MKSYVRKSNRKSSKPKKSFTQRVKRVITGAAQSKFISGSISLPAVISQTVYAQSPTQNIGNGTNIGGRIGDQVYLQSLQLNGYMFSSATALTNAKYRVSVVYSSLQIPCAAVSASPSFLPNDLFLSNTYTVNTVVGVYDPKAVNVLADVTIDLNSLVSTSQDIRSFAMDIPLKDFKMAYIDTGSPFGKTKNLYVVVQAYTPTTAAISNLGSVLMSWNLKFKDI